MVRVPTRARGWRPPSRFRPEIWLQRENILLDRSLSEGLEGFGPSRPRLAREARRLRPQNVRAFITGREEITA